MSDAAISRSTLIRDQMHVVIRALQETGCVALTGPSEVGKTTLAEAIASRADTQATVLSLNQEADRNRLSEQPALLTANNGKLVVIDEIQHMPNCLEIIRAQLDLRRRDAVEVGRFLLLGMSPRTSRLISDRLSTRCRQIELAPIHLLEMPGVRPRSMEAIASGDAPTDQQSTVEPGALSSTSDALWFRGGFPLSLNAENDEASLVWRREYLTACYRRDISQLSSTLTASSVENFFARVAARHTKEFDLSNHMPDELRPCIGYFEDMGLIRVVKPWPVTIAKTRTKHTKLYIRDSGIFHAIKRCASLQDVRKNGDIHGASWDGFNAENLIAAAAGKAEVFHYRADDDEIDLILDFGPKGIFIFEMKGGKKAVSDSYYRIADAMGATRRIVIRGVPGGYDGGQHESLSPIEAVRLVEQTVA